MSYKGVDVPALRELSKAMLGSKTDVEIALAQARHELEALPWHGPDRDRYVSEWGHHESVLRTICTGLEHAAADAIKHAEAQERISGGW